VPSTRDDSHGKWEQGIGKKDCMGSENRELGRRVAWEVGTGRWEEGLHGKWEQGTGKKDYMGSGNRERGIRITWEVGTGK